MCVCVCVRLYVCVCAGGGGGGAVGGDVISGLVLVMSRETRSSHSSIKK